MIIPELEKTIGIEVYASCSPGIGGTIRQRIEDFAVEEVLADGTKAEINPTASPPTHGALGASSAKERYLLCVLVKRNWDTLSAIKTIANQLGISDGQIQIGGIKDARAVTAQHITIEESSVEEINKVHIKDIELRPVGYLRNELSSFYLLGNSFNVTIHAVAHNQIAIERRIAKINRDLKDLGGIPNFFGHQRFGTRRPITHLVGKAIIEKDFEKSAMLFLTRSSPHEHREARTAREELQATMNFKEALKQFPKQLRYERLMLRRLAESPASFVEALKRLPTKLQELFVQAYQSFLFNKFLSRRMSLGLRLDKAEIGDNVLRIERSGLPMTSMSFIVTEENMREINKSLQAGKVRLALPLVGFKQQTSQGIQGSIEKQILEEEGIETGFFRVEEMPHIAARGLLRAAVAPLNDFSLGPISNDETEPRKLQAKMSFMLQRGSYATMFLREIMKVQNTVRAGF